MGFDQRGFGHSEGRPGMIESEKIIKDDLISYSKRIKERFAQDVPVFMIGHSLGGALAVITATEVPEIYRGVTLVAPYFDLYDKKALSKFLPVARMIARVWPSFKFKLDFKAIMAH